MPVNEKHLDSHDIHRMEHHQEPRHHQEPIHHQQHHYESEYRELETPHTIEPFKARSINDSTVHYHDYTDFPPEFYKAEYYSFYHKLSEDMNPDHHLTHDEAEHHLPFEPLRIHSYTDNGFYYYDDHPQTDFREETGYDAYMAGHHQQ